MPHGISQPNGEKMRTWCVHASEAPVVAVFARVYGEKPWTCVLRWKWSEAVLEEGAWTSMAIAAHRCCLSPDGEFLLYHAKGGSRSGPFPGYYGGAFAVSRLPWLSALTHTTTFGFAGGWESRDALPQAEQQRLWGMFEGWPMYVRDEHWPRQLGAAWHAATPQEMEGLGKVHLAATAELPGTKLRLHALARSRSGNWSIWHDDLKYFVGPADGSAGPAQELCGVRWAYPAHGSWLLVATTDAKLRVLRFKSNASEGATPAVEQEHDLAVLTPRPGPAPKWAKAGLSH